MFIKEGVDLLPDATILLEIDFLNVELCVSNIIDFFSYVDVEHCRLSSNANERESQNKLVLVVRLSK